jgi:hypothetical protein
LGAWLTVQRAKEISHKTYGCYRRYQGTTLLDASFFPTSDGRWYGELRLNNWTVKETYMDTLEEINNWCFDAFMELHTVGWQEEATT